MSEPSDGAPGGVPEDVQPAPSTQTQARANRLAGARRIRAGGAARRPGRGDGWRLTTADDALLAASTRFGVMTWRQASWRFYDEVERTTATRVGNLREAGLLRQSRNDEWAGRVVWPSAAGTSLVRDSLRVPVAAPQQYPGERLLHRLAVTDAGFRFEVGGKPVLTEREVRTCESTRGMAARVVSALGVSRSRAATDGNGVERWLCIPVGSSGQVHYPDLVLITDAGLVAVEVEITPKPVSRMRQVLRGYRDAQMFTQVIYLTTGPVAALLHGWNETDGHRSQWTDGVLQQLHLLPSGRPQYTADSPVRVQQFHPHDRGVAYRLDMKQAPDTWWVPKSEWRELRRQWEEDTDLGKAAQVPFLRWWQEIYVPRQRVGAHL